MVNPEPFELPKEQLIARLRLYEKKYGVITDKPGLHNWKNLFKKPTLQDWTILFMLIMMLFVAWSYSHDISACQDYMKDESNCLVNVPNNPTPMGLQIPNFTIKEDFGSDGT